MYFQDRVFLSFCPKVLTLNAFRIQSSLKIVLIAAVSINVFLKSNYSLTEEQKNRFSLFKN